MSRDPDNLTRKERLFLELLAPDGATIAQGTRVGAALARRGFVRVAKFGRWGITPAGHGALAGHGDLPSRYGPGTGPGKGPGTGQGTGKGTGQGTGNRARAGKGPGPGQLTLL